VSADIESGTVVTSANVKVKESKLGRVNKDSGIADKPLESL
jgi:hypothetical protein